MRVGHGAENWLTVRVPIGTPIGYVAVHNPVITYIVNS